jgi:hypothetical protein
MEEAAKEAAVVRGVATPKEKDTRQTWWQVHLPYLWCVWPRCTAVLLALQSRNPARVAEPHGRLHQH